MSIEEEFFKTFGIEQICPNFRDNDQWCEECVADYLVGDGCNYSVKHFPKITDRILLELICILNTVTIPDLGDINYVRLKMQILQECIDALTKVDWENREPTKEEFIEDVRSLFEGVEQ